MEAAFLERLIKTHWLRPFWKRGAFDELDRAEVTEGRGMMLVVVPVKESEGMVASILVTGPAKTVTARGKPTQNPFVGSFNGKFRDECLTEHWFSSLEDAREKIEAWRVLYNERRRHRSLPQHLFLELKDPEPTFRV